VGGDLKTSIRLKPNVLGHFELIVERNHPELSQTIQTKLSESPDFETALAEADNHVRENYGMNERFYSKGAMWRQAPASEKQVELLQKLGVPIPPQLSKGQASMMIDLVLSRRRK